MTRHRKFLKEEKAKTKLKGAKLPKGLNVTKTEFKVRKIVIRDQIKDPIILDGAILKSNIKVIFHTHFQIICLLRNGIEMNR